MISPKIVEALNRQANAESYSSHLYFAMAAYFEAVNLRGFAHWANIQAEEEVTHAKKIYEHIFDRLGRAKLSSVDQPPFEWGSPLEAVRAGFEHEVKVTGFINDLVNLAITEKDNTTFNFLQWFVAEQVEEEKSLDDIVQRLKIASNDPIGLLVVDSELAQRKGK